MTIHREPSDSVLDTIKETPFIRVHTSSDEVPVCAKLELFNPGMSVKDRIGKYMLERMLESGGLPESGTTVELTAGDTGIGFVVTAGQLGIRAMFVIPERFSVKKQTLICVFGTDVINMPTKDGMGSAIDHTYKLVDELDDAVVPQQLSDPLNPKAYYETTVPEVYDTFDSGASTLVAGYDVAGTLIRMVRYGREYNEDTFVAAVESEGLLYARLHGRDMAEAPYKTGGTGTHDPATNELFDPELVDELVQIADRDTHDGIQRLVAEEGHLIVLNAAANPPVAIDMAERTAASDLGLPRGAVVTAFPDSSE